ncbi:hypothetical protein BDR04DRAFT_1108386 [Suillus decipiens]|nr:hypothetical protein BDR04DRAFT_1108386 [Suillus decipiens]
MLRDKFLNPTCAVHGALISFILLTSWLTAMAQALIDQRDLYLWLFTMPRNFE